MPILIEVTKLGVAAALEGAALMRKLFIASVRMEAAFSRVNISFIAHALMLGWILPFQAESWLHMEPFYQD